MTIDDTIQRRPHLAFAAFWGAWIIYSLVTLVTGSMTLWWIWLGSFLAVEIPASLWWSRKRDTLSEIATWVQRKLSKHRRFARGWNAWMLLIIDILATTGTMPLWMDWRNVMYAAQVPILIALVGIWLYDHWTDPVEHG